MNINRPTPPTRFRQTEQADTVLSIASALLLMVGARISNCVRLPQMKLQHPVARNAVFIDPLRDTALGQAGEFHHRFPATHQINRFLRFIHTYSLVFYTDKVKHSKPIAG